MRSVCVVGAGPGGLVTTKTLLQTGQFEVTTYEKKHRVGGVWSEGRGSSNGFINPYTPTNLSRFAVSFSDLDWNTVDLDHGQPNGDANGSTSPTKLVMFPKAWMVNRYLETYRERYIPDGTITCDREVVKAERVDQKWRVTTQDSQSKQTVKEFDYLIMASGFFAWPLPLSNSVPDLSPDPGMKVLHSSRYRQLPDLFPDDQQPRGKKILVIGSANSATEAAATIANQLSNNKWSPDQPDRDRYEDVQIVHVMPRPLYPVAHFNEISDGSRSYLPVDWKFYDLSTRPIEMQSYGGIVPKEVNQMVHRIMQGMVGGDQADISSALYSPKINESQPPYAAIVNSYAEYVRSGVVDVIKGRVTKLQGGKSGDATATVTSEEGEIEISDVAAVIYGTGYSPHPALNTLDEDTKRALHYDPKSLRIPMILDQWQTLSREIPEISFVGFYENAYWGVLELQAHLIANRWLSGNYASTTAYETQESLLALRKAIADKETHVPQFSFPDYTGYMDDISAEIGLQRNDNGFGPREGCPVPARYLAPTTDRKQADAIMKELHELWNDAAINGKYVPCAALRSLQGNWAISRRIESSQSPFPSSTFEGTASFHPRSPSQDKSGRTFDLEYYYIESGTFTTSNGYTMNASRRYVYRYSEYQDKLSVWFVKPDSDLEVDYLFHDLQFVKPEEARKAGASIAKAYHLCVKDKYWTEYRLPLKGTALTSFEVKHTVKGPDKDYIATAKYVRPSTR